MEGRSFGWTMDWYNSLDEIEDAKTITNKYECNHLRP